MQLRVGAETWSCYLRRLEDIRDTLGAWTTVPQQRLHQQMFHRSGSSSWVRLGLG